MIISTMIFPGIWFEGSLQSVSGYVSWAEEGAKCNSEHVRQNQIFTFQLYGDLVAISSCGRGYLSAPLDGRVGWVDGEPGPAQLFTVLKAEEQAGSRMAFKSVESRYLCAEGDWSLSCLEESLVKEGQLFEMCISAKTLDSLV